jgi:glycerophosphoryl diester phosphodiesterase
MSLHRVAHRGYSAVAPENTMPALAAAVLGGATYVEFDVRTTADGVPVVIHDRTVDRTTDGTGHVWELTLDEVRSLDAGSWFSAAYAGVRVPLLTEALDLLVPPEPGVAPPAAGDAPQLLLEIKPPASLEEVKTIIDMVAERGFLDRTVVQSFDPEVVRLVREVAPEVRRGLLRLRFEADTVSLAEDLGVVCCNPSVADVLADPVTMAELAEAGIEVMPWTANDMGDWAALVEAGVAGLITDRAGELTGWAELAGCASLGGRSPS